MLKKLTILILLGAFTSGYLYAQDATIYFYRKAKFKGTLIEYDIFIDTDVVGKMTTGKVLVKSLAAGTKRISAKTESEQSIFLNVEAGKTYFIECGISIGVLVGIPTLRQRQPPIAIEAIQKINPSLSLSQTLTGAFVPTESDLRADTVSAVSNLFIRKRKNGIARGGIFAGFAVGGTVSTGDPVGAILPAVLAVQGFVQAGKYKSEKLDSIINDYQNGKALPPKIRKKLKEKDFK